MAAQGQLVTEQAGPSVTAIRQRQAELTVRQTAVVAADRILAEALASAHEVNRDSVRRLEGIAAEIERARELVGDTPLAAREFQKFLVAKQREIAAVVTVAKDLSHAKSVVLQELLERYRG